MTSKDPRVRRAEQIREAVLEVLRAARFTDIPIDDGWCERGLIYQRVRRASTFPVSGTQLERALARLRKEGDIDMYRRPDRYNRITVWRAARRAAKPRGGA